MSSDPAGGTFVTIGTRAPDEAAARRTLERMRTDAIAERQPHYDVLRAAYPSPPEYEERAAVMAVLLGSLSPADVVALFRLLYDEPGTAVHHQVELITDGATVDEDMIRAVTARLRAAGWPAG